MNKEISQSAVKPNTLLFTETYSSIRTNLESILTVSQSDKPSKFYFERLTGNMMNIPRYFDYNTYGVRAINPKKSVAYDDKLFAKVKTIKFVPRNDKQVKTVKFLEENAECSLILSTGSGKTRCTLNHIIANNLKAVVLCHKTVIMNQWKETFLDMSDELTEDDIYLLSGNYSMKKMLAAKIIISSSKTFSSRLHSDKRDKFTADINSLKLDTFVVDEAHLMLDSNNTALLNFYTPNLICLTATPVRSIVAESEMMKFVYPLHNTLELIEYEQPVKCFFYSFDSRPNHKDIWYVSTSCKYKLEKNNYFNYLKRDNNWDSYWKMIYYNIIGRLRTKYGNNMKFLITGLKLDTLDKLYEEFSNVPDGNVIKRHYGSYKEEAKSGDDTQITLSVLSTINAGYDVSDLNVLINLVPMSSESMTIQVKGRPARLHDGKEIAYYIALVDQGFPEITKAQTKQLGHITTENLSPVSFISDNIVFEK